MKKPNWRLKKTLSRRVETRPIEDGDIRFAWAAYKSGKLPLMKDGLEPAQFKTEFEKLVLSSFHAAWIVSAIAPKGFMPIGIVFGSWMQVGAPIMVIAEIDWFPWASKRNVIEGTVGFFNTIRKQFPWIGFAKDEHKPIYEVCMRHGIMRRIGTSQLFNSGPMAVFEGKQ